MFTDAVEQAGHQPRKNKRREAANRNTENRELRSIPENEAENVFCLRTHRHANADLTPALLNGVCRHAIESGGSKNQRQRAEQGNQGKVELLRT